VAKPLTLGEEEVAMYYYLGHAIQSWAFVEITLREIVLACVDDDLTRKSVAVGFVSIDGFKAKMDFAEGIVGRKFVSHSAEWADLVKATRALSQKRNRLAHRGLALYPESAPGRRYVLSPWKYEKPKKKSKRPAPPPGSLGLLDIVKCDIEFIHCSMTLRNFAARLARLPEPHAEGHEPLARPPTIRQLADRIREGLANPPGSFAETPQTDPDP
jgi:hypothetical protein